MHGEPREYAIPYFLGRLAIDAGWMFRMLWGCEKMFNLMAEEKTAGSLEEHYDFKLSDFLRLTKTAEFFKQSNISLILRKVINHISPGLFEAIRKIIYGPSPAEPRSDPGCPKNRRIV
jgi:hypothetical protein